MSRGFLKEKNGFGTDQWLRCVPGGRPIGAGRGAGLRQGTPTRGHAHWMGKVNRERKGAGLLEATPTRGHIHWPVPNTGGKGGGWGCM